MNTRYIALCLALIVALNSGCHLTRLLPRPRRPGLHDRITTLRSSLDDGEMTLDQYEHSKHNLLHAGGQPSAMNAR